MLFLPGYYSWDEKKEDVGDEMNESALLKIISRMIFPFVVLFGMYIIFNGDLSPGGGFQGGVVLASSYLLLYFINDKNTLSVKRILKIEKVLFLMLLFFSFVGIFTHGTPFRGMFFGDTLFFKKINLMALNIIIGMKVTLGIVGIIGIFLEEGEL